MKPVNFLTAMITAILALCCNQAHATTIQDDYGIFAVNFLTGSPVNGALPGFNPALGSLTAVDFKYVASAVLLQGTAQSSQITIDDSTGTLLTDITFPMITGRADQVEMGSFAVPAADLADFESTGNVDLTLDGFTACRGSANTPTGCSEFTGAVSGQVSYIYTPAPTPTTPMSAAPEPNSLLLFACGLLAAALAIRRLRRSGVE